MFKKRSSLILVASLFLAISCLMVIAIPVAARSHKAPADPTTNWVIDDSGKITVTVTWSGIRLTGIMGQLWDSTSPYGIAGAQNIDVSGRGGSTTFSWQLTPTTELHDLCLGISLYMNGSNTEYFQFALNDMNFMP